MDTPASKLSHALENVDESWRTKPLVLMVSGGSDSTALAYLVADALTARETPTGTTRDERGERGGRGGRDERDERGERGGRGERGERGGRGERGERSERSSCVGSAELAHRTARDDCDEHDGRTARATRNARDERDERDRCTACCVSVGFPMVGILHVNHGLRGAAADADERFVEELARTLGFPFYCSHVDVAALARAEGGNEEAIGRRERYAAGFEVLADLHAQASAYAESIENTETTKGVGGSGNAQDAGSARDTGGAGDANVWSGYILTAHTQDDRVENFYMRSIVGTGPGGFRGMARQNGCVLHPLLDCAREELRDYITQRAAEGAPTVCITSGTLWCEDATNAIADHFRTFVRHEIVPKAKEQNARLLDTLTRSMDLIADEDDYLDKCAQALIRAHVGWVNPLGPDWFSQRMGGILPDTQLTVVEEGATPPPDYSAGCVLSPRFAEEPLVLKRRAIFRVLQLILGEDARVETASVHAVLTSLGTSGAVTNIQGNLAVSTNKHGTRIEPMEAFRARRKRL